MRAKRPFPRLERAAALEVSRRHGRRRSDGDALRELGHDVVHAREAGYHTLLDAELLAHARSQSRIVLTFDLDFGDLLAAAGESLPSVVLIRTHNQRAESVTPRVLDVAERFAHEFEAGALIVVEDARVRLRRLPLR